MTEQERDNLSHGMRSAARKGDLAEVKRLVAAGAQVDSIGYDMTALQLAAQEGHLPVMEFLVENGAQIDLKTVSEAPPLNHAILYGHIHAVKFLLEAGARVDIGDHNGWQPLHHAANGVDRVGAALCLIAFGADVDARDRLGWQPLHVAAGRGREDMASFLLGAGANPYAANNRGHTPMWLAEDKHPETFAVFAEWERHCGERWRREEMVRDIHAHWKRVKKHFPSAPKPSL